MTDDVTRSRQAAVVRRLRERDELAELVECYLMDCAREFYSYRSEAGTVGLDTGSGNGPVMIDCHALADKMLADGWRRID